MSAVDQDVADFFNNMGGGGGGAPSFAFKNVGDTVKGKVISARSMGRTEFGTSTPLINKKTGLQEKQVQVILETNLRNWDGCTNPGKDQDGNELPGSEDTGSRAIYVKSMMGGAVADAIGNATGGLRRFPAPGDILAVQLSGRKPSGKGKPTNLFAANAVAAPEGFESFAANQEEKTETAAANPSALNLDDEDNAAPPF